MKNCRFPLVRPKYFGVIFFLACQPISTIHLFLATTTNSGEKAKKKIIIDRHLLFGMNVRIDSIISHVLCVVNTTHTHISLFIKCFASMLANIEYV